MLNKHVLIKFLFAFLAFVVIIILIRQAGSFLVRSDKLNKSDAIIVLMGSIPDRVLYASDLYKQGIASLIIVVEPEKRAWKNVMERGVQPLIGAEQFKDVALKLGVPDSCVSIIPGEARSTKQEAEIIAGYLKTHPSIDTITVVTTNGHTRRAGYIFERIFEKERLDVVLYISSSPYSQQDLKYWYRDRDKAEMVVFEWIKLITSYFEMK